MFFKKSKPITCSVCGKTIGPKDSRFMDKNRVTKEERHAHLDCHKTGAVKA